jgi:hypothetical protein
MIDAIRLARRTINLEALVMNPGAVTDRFIDALTERARAGVPRQRRTRREVLSAGALVPARTHVAWVLDRQQ